MTPFDKTKTQTSHKGKSVFFWCRWRVGICFASALLDHPNASRFGTGLHTNTLKTIINCFFDARCPLRVRLPFNKKRNNTSYEESFLFLVPMAGVEPARCCHRRILSPLRLPIPSHRLNGYDYTITKEKNQYFFLKKSETVHFYGRFCLFHHFIY